jgi:hypothetical protein
MSIWNGRNQKSLFQIDIKYGAIARSAGSVRIALALPTAQPGTIEEFGDISSQAHGTLWVN